MKETMDKIKTSFDYWWAKFGIKKRPELNPARLVTVEELPMYPDEIPYYKEVKEPSLSVREELALLKRAILYRLFNVKESSFSVEEKPRKFFSFSYDFTRRLQQDYGMLPQAAAITAGGLIGFLYGMKKSVLRRFVYSGTGLIIMTAFCYPYEAIAISRTAVEYSRTTWNDFVRTPKPPEFPPRHASDSQQ